MASVGTIQAEIANLLGIMSGLTPDNPAYPAYQQALAGLQLELYQAQNSIPQPGLAVDSVLAAETGGVDVANPDSAPVMSTSQDQTFDTSQGLS